MRGIGKCVECLYKERKNLYISESQWDEIHHDIMYISYLSEKNADVVMLRSVPPCVLYVVSKYQTTSYCPLLKLSLMRSFCFSRHVIAILLSGREICWLPTNSICDRPGAALLCLFVRRILGLNRSKHSKLYPGCRLGRCVLARRQHDAGPASAPGGLLPGLWGSQL